MTREFTWGCLLASVMSFASISSELPAQSSATTTTPGKATMVTTDPGRVTIHQDKFGKSVRDAKGNLLRGPSLGLYKYARQIKLSDYIYDDSYWKLLQENGFNAVRAVFFDPWQRSHGHAGTNKPFPFADLKSVDDVRAMLKEFDHVVDTAAAHDMYVLINYHDTGGYTDPKYDQVADEENEFTRGKKMYYLRLFWKFMAKRYADRTHVFYELTNEPVKWTAEEYTNRNLADFKKLYDQVRKDAPKTHMVLLTFANHASFKGEIHMVDIARKMKNLGVSFENESVGYHPYNAFHPKPNPGKNILALKREFPIINTEQNFPKGMAESSNDTDASGLDGDKFGVQSNEKYGISWFHWQCDNPKRVRENFMRNVIPDAREKGYYWVEQR